MNVDSSDSQTNESTIKSKYFCGPPVMDESLSEFQEKKSTLAGPKTSEKPPVKKIKTKKPLKRIRGQKDIRTVLNKNELVKYSKEFDKVCKQSGLDVDPEQLQLAIALSKSLEQSETQDPRCSSSLTTQERQVKIRTTLQEYGFKVPEIKISVPKSRKAKSRLHYKLITANDSEKKQLISDKYAQVLFETANHKTLEDSKNLIPEMSLFGKATIISYETIKSNHIFYVDKLIEKHANSVGTLLRDWSEIPGRPSSPATEKLNINFDEIDCTPYELDRVLSGTLEVAQKIIRSKCVNINKSVHNIEQTLKLEDNIKMHLAGVSSINDNKVRSDPKCSTLESNSNSLKIQVEKQARSCSPDIFDDDVTIIDDSFNTISVRQKTAEIFVAHDKTDLVESKEVHTNHLINGRNTQLSTISTESKSNEVIEIISDKESQNVLSNSYKTDFTKRKPDDFMEITDVIAENILSQNFQQGSNFSKLMTNDFIEIPQSQSTETTKRKSDDFMEITDAIGQKNLSQKSQERNFTKRKTNDCTEMTLSQKTDITKRRSDDFMEITDTIEVNFLSQKSQGSNFTKRKTNDFMEITNAIGENILSQKSQRFNVTKRITKDFTEITECIDISPDNQDIVEESVDLTQTDTSEYVEAPTQAHENVNLTQFSDSSDDTLPFVDIGGKNSLLEDTTTSHANKMFDAKSDNKEITGTEEILISSEDCKDVETNSQECYSNVSKKVTNKSLDHSSRETSPEKTVSNSKSKKESFFEEFSFHHSEDSSKEKNEIYVSDESSNRSVVARNISKVSEYSVNLTQTYETPVKVDFNDDIDLTQSTDSLLSNNDNETSLNIERNQTPQITYEQFGKIDDVSIDYDEVYVNRDIVHTSVDHDDLFDNVVDSCNPSGSKSSKNSKEDSKYKSKETTSSNNEIKLSQDSEVFEISDNELDYSIQKSRRENFDLGGISVIDNIPSMRRSKSVSDIYNVNHDALDLEENSFLPEVHMKNSKDANTFDGKDSLKTYSNSQPPISRDKNVENILKDCIKTPLGQKYIIKMDEVTPIADYASLTTPDITKELDRYGVKPLKRRRAVQLLTHIYHQTHPTIESCSDDIVSPSKKLKTHHTYHDALTVSDEGSPKKSKKKSPRKRPLSSTIKNKEEETPIESNKENNIYEVTSDVPVIRDLECSEDDWVFQKREKAKLHSCRVPLHIALHNYVSARRRLREAILRYEPVNIDVIHKGLVANGLRYDPKDLLKYMDKKCITVKTADNNVKNRKHY